MHREYEKTLPRFCEYDTNQLRLFTYCRQENAVVSHQIYRTWEVFLRDSLYALFATQHILSLFNHESFKSESQNYQHIPQVTPVLFLACLILHVVESRGEREDFGLGAFPDKPISGKRCSQSYGWMDGLAVVAATTCYRHSQ